MLLYVDETENEEFFIVAGLLIDSRDCADKAYKHFKNSIKNIPIQPKEKAKLFTEFKSTILDRRYKKVKIKMLESLNETERTVIYSCFIKKDGSFDQYQKEKAYIILLSNIVTNVAEDISIIFDAFNKTDFESRIVQSISEHRNVQAIMPRDSQLEPGLQYIDNICSTLRLMKSNNDKFEFYQYIENWVKEV